jgi:hypothetical protein
MTALERIRASTSDRRKIWIRRHSLPVMGILFGLCCAVILTFALLDFVIDSWRASPTFTYPNLSNAFERKAVQLGWMPSFLPPSAKNIREKRNGEDGTSILAFEFAPADFSSLSSMLTVVESGRFKKIRPRRVFKPEPWFPRAILEGQLNELQAEGFTIYETDIEYFGKARLKKRWFAAVNPQNGICYTWRRYVQD